MNTATSAGMPRNDVAQWNILSQHLAFAATLEFLFFLLTSAHVYGFAQNINRLHHLEVARRGNIFKEVFVSWPGMDLEVW